MTFKNWITEELHDQKILENLRNFLTTMPKNASVSVSIERHNKGGWIKFLNNKSFAFRTNKYLAIAQTVLKKTQFINLTV